MISEKHLVSNIDAYIVTTKARRTSKKQYLSQLRLERYMLKETHAKQDMTIACQMEFLPLILFGATETPRAIDMKYGYRSVRMPSCLAARECKKKPQSSSGWWMACRESRECSL